MHSQRGIHPPYEVFYIEAMLFNTSSALTSVESINATLEAIAEDQAGELFQRLDHRALLDELQNVVVHAAALSPYFWPTSTNNDRYTARGEQLRAALGIAEDSPLKGRQLRNHIEHFDEKLDEYLKEGIAGHILPEYVGLMREPDGVPVHHFRAYYLDTGTFEMLGKRYDVQPIVEELSRIHEVLIACGTGRLPRAGE
jgi:hypothetical protein